MSPKENHTFVLVLLSIIILSNFMLSSEARLSKKIDSQIILLELGYYQSKIELYRRKLSVNRAAIDHVSPGGPDPQHH